MRSIGREDIPEVIRTYLDRHHENDTQGAIATFAEEAVVIDEGQTYTGISEIRNWLNRTASEYTYTSAETGYELPSAGKCVVHIHLAGNFPGGEADLTSTFSYNRDKITELRNS